MTWLGRYELVEPLGHGAMGEIWLARDAVLGRDVAVKVVTRRTDDPLDDERMLREAHAAAQISHPNVVAIHDLGRAEGRPFLVMELVEGRTIASLLKAGPPSIDEARSILEQTLAGLRAAHARGVVHRDIKPANLMVGADGVVKIVDFGLADDGWGARITRQGSFMGTAAYAAPERVLGKTFDACADLYSLGCVLYELLTGSPPFEGDILAQTYAHVHHRPEPPSRLRTEVPPDLDAFTMALLAKDPGLRPDSLENFDPSELGSASPGGPWLLAGGRRKVLVGVLATMVAAGAVLAYSSEGLREPRSSTSTDRTDPGLPSAPASVDVEAVPGTGGPPDPTPGPTPGPDRAGSTAIPVTPGSQRTPPPAPTAAPSKSPGTTARPEPSPSSGETSEPRRKKKAGSDPGVPALPKVARPRTR